MKCISLQLIIITNN